MAFNLKFILSVLLVSSTALAGGSQTLVCSTYVGYCSAPAESTRANLSCYCQSGTAIHGLTDWLEILPAHLKHPAGSIPSAQTQALATAETKAPTYSNQQVNRLLNQNMLIPESRKAFGTK